MGKGRDGIDLLFAACPQERQVLGHVEPHRIESGNRGRSHHVATLHQTWMICVSDGMAIAHNLIEQPQPRPGVVRLGMKYARFCLAWLEIAQGLWHRNLQNKYLICRKRLFRNTMA